MDLVTGTTGGKLLLLPHGGGYVITGEKDIDIDSYIYGCRHIYIQV